jgi:hypothetical protein
MSSCHGCGAPLTWARSETGKLIPLDFIPSLPEHPRLQVPDPLPAVQRYTVRFEDPREPIAVKDATGSYLSHFVTCPDRDKFTRRGKKKGA